jgi:hypothetical protein
LRKTDGKTAEVVPKKDGDWVDIRSSPAPKELLRTKNFQAGKDLSVLVQGTALPEKNEKKTT